MINDPLFSVTCLERTPDPQTLIWQAMHQDYSEHLVSDELPPDECEAGKLAVKHLLAGGRGHFGPLEHPSITFSCGYFPHSVMQQARTHRVSVSFDVQSMRYTGSRILALVNSDNTDPEEIFYLRPVGTYTDRFGKKYTYNPEQRQADLDFAIHSAHRYADAIKQGQSYEHARGMLPFDFRQHFVVSFNLRSLLHFLDLRHKADAQPEIQQLAAMMAVHTSGWCPEIWNWYEASRLNKAKLAP